MKITFALQMLLGFCRCDEAKQTRSQWVRKFPDEGWTSSVMSWRVARRQYFKLWRAATYGKEASHA